MVISQYFSGSFILNNQIPWNLERCSYLLFMLSFISIHKYMISIHDFLLLSIVVAPNRIPFSLKEVQAILFKSHTQHFKIIGKQFHAVT